jgi:hypothetical protein
MVLLYSIPMFMQNSGKKTALKVFPIVLLFSSHSVLADNTDGVGVKTNHPDPNNVTLFYADRNVVKAIGYGRIAGKL